MIETLKLSPRITMVGAGIYEAGAEGSCYIRLFVTDTGKVLPTNHRVLTDEDLLTAYEWGREDALLNFFPHD